MLDSNLKTTGTWSTLTLRPLNSLSAISSYDPCRVSAILAKGLLTFFCIGLLVGRPTLAKNLFLVSAILEDGAVVRSGGNVEVVDRATYLPYDKRISVRPRSGLETLSSGRSLRFGAGTIFTVEENSVVLHEGSFLYSSRKMGSSLLVKGPESEVTLDGLGTLMLQVEPNGGFRLVALLGRLRITDGNAKLARDLLPGELLFVKPGGLGFGDLVQVSLKKLLRTSFLISGFKNLSSFTRSLAIVVKAQEESIGKRFNAEVGEARGANTFEVVPIKPDSENASIGKPPLVKGPTQVPDQDSAPLSVPPIRQVFSVNSDISPLEEFLGRSPKRFAGSQANTVSVKNSPPAGPSVAPEVMPAKVVFPEPRIPAPPQVSTFEPTRTSIGFTDPINQRVRTLRRRQDGESTFLFVSDELEEPKLSPAPQPQPQPLPSAVLPSVERKRLPGRLFDLP